MRGCGKIDKALLKLHCLNTDYNFLFRKKKKKFLFPSPNFSLSRDNSLNNHGIAKRAGNITLPGKEERCLGEWKMT
jgi:hypothetical protein